ncbi:hypothetical protein SNEBB_005187 [Seison nebaliae]|nr:hypothetical protein SNEBB_005187 [Seison nebaliae]
MWDSVDLIPFSGMAVYTIIGVALDQGKNASFSGWLALLLSGLVSSISFVTYLHLKMMLVGYHNVHQIMFRVFGVFSSYLMASLILGFTILIVAIFAQSCVYHIFWLVGLAPIMTPGLYELAPSTFDYWPTLVILVLTLSAGISKHINRTILALLNMVVVIGYCINLMVMGHRNKHIIHPNTIFHIEYERVLGMVKKIFFAFGTYPIFISVLNRCETLKIETEYCICCLYTILLYIIPAVVSVFYSYGTQVVSYAMFPSTFGRFNRTLLIIWSTLPAIFNIFIILLTFRFVHLFGMILTADGLFKNYRLLSSGTMSIPPVSLFILSIVASVASIVLLSDILMQLASLILTFIFMFISFTAMIFPLLRHHPLLACPCVYGTKGNMSRKDLFRLYCDLSNGNENKTNRGSGTNRSKNNDNNNNNNSNKDEWNIIYRYECNCPEYSEDEMHLECKKCTRNLGIFMKHYHDNHVNPYLLPKNVNYHNRNILGSGKTRSQSILVHTLDSVVDLVDIKQLAVCFILVLYMGSLFIYMRSVYMLQIPFRIGFFVIIVILGLFSVSLSAPYVLNQCPKERITFTNPLSSILFPIVSLSLQITILSSYSWKIYLILLGYGFVASLSYLILGISKTDITEPTQPLDVSYMQNMRKGLATKLLEDIAGKMTGDDNPKPSEKASTGFLKMGALFKSSKNLEKKKKGKKPKNYGKLWDQRKQKRAKDLELAKINDTLDSDE